ncbi:MAG TPA: hypothetical protein V6C97_30170 [Oculatellaceae cyanobacterium]
MIAFEALFIFITAMAAITLIGRPLAKAYSEKVQSLPSNMTAAEQRALRDRVATLEMEVSELRRNVVALQDSTEFAMKMLENKGASLSSKGT